MKAWLTAAVVMILCITASHSSSAAAKDTLTVYASVSSLDQIINADTVSGGAQAHTVYKLVSRDTTYIYLGAVSVKSSITVIGVLGSNGRPPCIQPGILSDGSVADILFALKGTGTRYTFKNLYLMGSSTSNTQAQWGDGIRLLGDKIALTCDNVVFEGWWGDCIAYYGDHNSFYLTNNKFRNGNQPSWYSGEVLRCQNANAYTDTLIMKNNTILCVTAYAACPITKKYLIYFEFSHNSVLWMFKNPFFAFNVTTAKINNNIFYATYAGGLSKTEYEWWDQLYSLEVGSIIDLDNLDAEKDSIMAPAAYGTSTQVAAAEAKRVIEVKNNVYFKPAELTAFQKAWNDTAHVDSVYTSPWMNARTTKMFTDKTMWPGLTESGNQNVDPGYGAGIKAVLNNNVGNGVGFLQYFKTIRTEVSNNDVYGYKIQTVAGANWIPTWPLPEMADMQYSNTALKTGGTDGKPVGDPGWFTNGYTSVSASSAVTPGTFELSEAYPNPFNPSTTIRFSLPVRSSVRLIVFNMLGQVVKEVVNGTYEAGQHSVVLNASSMSSGVYFYQMNAGGFVSTKKLTLLK